MTQKTLDMRISTVYHGFRELINVTIKQFADAHGVSVQAVYQRMKKAKIDIESSKDAETGELTASAREQLEKMFTSKRSTDGIELERLKVENEFLKQRIDELQQRLADLASERDSWRRQAEKEQQLVAQAQAVIRLPGATQGKTSFWHRITGRKDAI